MAEGGINYHYENLYLNPEKARDPMKYETLRLGTFQSFSSNSQNVSCVPFVKKGFFVTDRNLIKCFSCGSQIRQFDMTLDPLCENQQLSPRCSFTSENIPMLEMSNPTAESRAPLERMSLESGAVPRRNIRGTSNNEAKTTQEQQAVHPIYANRSDRLRTFTSFSTTNAPNPEQLAQAGFFYQGTFNHVICFFCDVSLRNIKPHEDPWAEHVRFFPECEFVREKKGERFIRQTKARLDQQNFNYTYPPQAGIIWEQAKHQNYCCDNIRLRSFHNKCNSRIPCPKQLSAAGFFHAGSDDNVKCFFCDGGLRNWEPNDDPWTEHARWFPRCGYLRLCKGDEYIKEVQETLLLKETNMQEPQCHQVRTNMRRMQDFMKTDLVRKVLDICVARRKVEEAVIYNLEKTGEFFNSPEELLKVVMTLQEFIDVTMQAPLESPPSAYLEGTHNCNELIQGGQMERTNSDSTETRLTVECTRSDDDEPRELAV